MLRGSSSICRRAAPPRVLQVPRNLVPRPSVRRARPGGLPWTVAASTPSPASSPPRALAARSPRRSPVPSSAPSVAWSGSVGPMPPAPRCSKPAPTRPSAARAAAAHGAPAAAPRGAPARPVRSAAPAAAGKVTAVLIRGRRAPMAASAAQESATTATVAPPGERTVPTIGNAVPAHAAQTPPARTAACRERHADAAIPSAAPASAR
ncbi:MAG: hypothetical protein QOF01_4416 [Thermomicrobiales bacterium]|jgi:hypothetical protein|nr:hypothetical protein [Thermomicrobiales bacterium]MEA2597947.1 hypothetical protein [Thermomicrobiales bacterium]